LTFFPFIYISNTKFYKTALLNTLFAKRQQQVREVPKPGAATNPSKRHRERLNEELETVAALLPFEQNVISRLDKLSVLRLAVSYLQIKSHFQDFSFLFSNTYPYLQTRSSSYKEKIPFILNSNEQLIADSNNHSFDEIALKALGGFILILNENGEIYYASENIEAYLGFHQSDILHQPLFEMIHSEDREEIEQQLNWRCNLPPNFTCLQEVFNAIHYLERNVSARFRCLLDNTCGFLRIDMRGKLMALHRIPRSIMFGRNDVSNPANIVLGLIAICSPFVPPIEQFVDDSILKTKHSLDLTLISMDNRIKNVLEISEKNLPKSFYALIHTDDILYVAEAHREVTKNGVSGLLIYRIVSARANRTYWIQSSCRMFYKNGKAESIGLTHRLLTEVEGTVLLEKQATIRTKIAGNQLMTNARPPPPIGFYNSPSPFFINFQD
uniref:Aryl hydrocarbon receptor n=1 Tax=Syphacia muris TaxID=451379 RepID=A0A0N5AT81_9BILA